MDGHSFERDLDSEDLELLWTVGLGKDLNDVKGMSSFRSASGLQRANFQLVKTVILKEFVCDPFFSFVKTTLDERHTYTGKVLMNKSFN